MNVLPSHDRLDPRIWQDLPMRAALARHDLSDVYRRLRAAGVSQRQVARLTGQNQSEVSDIAQGRQVQAYDLLVRIADGLGIPRGYMGLAYTDGAAQQLANEVTSELNAKDEYMKNRRNFLGLVSKIVMGAALTPAELDLLSVAPEHVPTPQRVGAADVAQLRIVTKALRAHDATHGGGSCRSAILAQTEWAESLLAASCPDDIRPDLLSAVADLKTLAGWTAHDLGLSREARQHLAQALQVTQEAENPAHTAVVLYHLGRVPLDNGDPFEALKLFQLGQIAAQESNSSAAVALLLANEAMAYAHLADARQALTALRRAEDEYTHIAQNEP